MRQPPVAAVPRLAVAHTRRQSASSPSGGFFLRLYRRKNGGKRIRTDDPLLAKQVLYQLSYAPVVPIRRSRRTDAATHPAGTPHGAAPGGVQHLRGTFPAPWAPGKMGQGGLEPPTPRLSSVCSNQLSYWPPSLARTTAREPSSQPRSDHGMGEGCADGADPERSGTPREITRWPARLAGCDGGWIGDVPETRPSLRRTAAPASFADDV